MIRVPEIKSIPEYAFEALRDEIDRFQKSLPADTETGIVANGGGSVIHIERFYSSGQMLVFEGVDSEGRSARLVQHYTQANVQMVSVPKQNEEPRRIGF